MNSVPVKSLAMTTAPGIRPVSTPDWKADSISGIVPLTAVVESILYTNSWLISQRLIFC